MNVAPNRGFLRSGNFLVSLKFTSDRPRLLWQSKFGNFNIKIAKTRQIQEIEPQCCTKQGVFEVKQFAVCYWHLHQTDPGFHGNESVKILTQN